MEFQVSHYEFTRPLDGTNLTRLKAVFEEEKRRFESFAREYHYVSSDPGAPEAVEAARLQQGLDREAAVRAGLLEAFASHHVAAYDGAAAMDFCAIDNRRFSTTITDPASGTLTYLFDPRCLGLTRGLSVRDTIETCLNYRAAKSVRLANKESIEGLAAWHISVTYSGGETAEFWIDESHLTHVLKFTNGQSVVFSRYDENNPKDSLPIEVTRIEYRNSAPLFVSQFVRTSTQYDVPVDPVSWTLGGLGMPVGTDVSDNRIHRRIGYWTGSGLSENLPPKKVQPASQVNKPELVSVIENYPSSPEALEAATWILLNTPDGSDVDKAAQVILDNHITSSNLLFLCKELVRFRHKSSTTLLETILEKNPSRDVRGNACFSLALLQKAEAKYGKNAKATAEAEKLFARAGSEFGQVKRGPAELEDLSKPELYELRRLTIGKPAPEIEGLDLDGKPLKLSDYRGKVVALMFWSDQCPMADERREQRELVRRLGDKPFAMVGVNCDRDLERAKAVVQEAEITWPSFDDGRNGPIATTWNVDSWPTIFVLDKQGVIRDRNVRGRELVEAVQRLIQR
jgi:peroxiredoxin